MRYHHAIETKWILSNYIEEFLVKKVEELTIDQSKRLVSLFHNRCESAYISRYRGDVHGGLPPERIRKAYDAYFDAIDLNLKVTSTIENLCPNILGNLARRNLEKRLRKCETMNEVDEICHLFSKLTITSSIERAKEYGLESAANMILDGKYVKISSLVTGKLKSYSTAEKYLTILVADMINKDPVVLKKAIKIAEFDTNCDLGVITNISRRANESRENLKYNRSFMKYRDYIGCSWSAEEIKYHTVQLLNRAAKEGILSWEIEIKQREALQIHPFYRKKVHPNMQELFRNALDYSVEHNFIPLIQRMAKKHLSELSESRSIKIFGENVEQLFSQKGIRDKYVIALDPGSRVKAAFLDPNGNPIDLRTFYLDGTEFERNGRHILRKWSRKTHEKKLVFAVGNGSHTYQTQKAISRMIKDGSFPERVNAQFCVVPEHGASKYSCTEAATEEFGDDIKIQLISAVSIGRRLIDPMGEYCKIEPQHLGKGQYQLSIDEKLLKLKLDDVVRDRVSLIGTNLNTASRQLLQNICGLNREKAEEIIKYRELNGRFQSRNELRKVDSIDDQTFQQCSGFLTVTAPDITWISDEKDEFSWCPLDQTRIHPDDYDITLNLLEKLDIGLSDITDRLKTLSIDLTEKEESILDLLKSKSKVNLKPPPVMKTSVPELKELAVGEKYTGTVRNRTDFGVFVDIGMEEDGMIHINHFHSDEDMKKDAKSRKPIDELDIPSVGDVIDVIVDKLNDMKIGLRLAPKERKSVKSMKSVSAQRKLKKNKKSSPR